MMIARLWHGETPVGKADDYLRLTRKVGLTDYMSTPGCKGAFVLRRLDGATAHFHTLSFWSAMNDIAAFAGQNVEQAKYYDFDRNFLKRLEPAVDHFELYTH